MSSSPAARLSALLLLLLAAACRSAPNSVEGIPEGGVRERLREWARGMSAEVQLASEQIDAAVDARDTHELTLHWRLRTVTTAREIVSRNSTREALFDAWSYAAQMLAFFREGDGAELFGEHTHLAVEALERVEQDIARTVRSIVGDERVERATRGVERYVAAHPMRGLFTREPFSPRRRGDEPGEQLQSLLDIPLSVLKPFDETASAVESFNDKADNFTATVNDLPDMLRWSTELLAYQLESHALLEQVEESASTVDQLGEKLARWDEDLASTWSTLLAELDRHQEPLRSTLGEARATVDQVGGALETVRALVCDVDATLGSVRETADALGIEPRAADAPAGGDPGPSTAEQLEDVRASTQNLAATAEDLRAGLDELRGLIASGELSRASDELRGLAAESVDHAAWRAAELLALAALLALAVVLAARLLARRRAHTAPDARRAA